MKWSNFKLTQEYQESNKKLQNSKKGDFKTQMNKISCLNRIISKQEKKNAIVDKAWAKLKENKSLVK